MTDDTSPKNLRKFLESDDPALITMGLSMAKGVGVPEELLPTILRFYMWNNDKTVRDSAELLFFKYASKEIQANIKKNWQVEYRTLSIGNLIKVIRPFLFAFKSQDNFSLIALEPLINALRDKDEDDLGIIATSLSKIVKKNKLENSKEILKFLKSNEEGMKRMGASMLKGILEE